MAKTSTTSSTVADEAKAKSGSAILTETDKILENFRHELDSINKRVKLLEKERSQFEQLLESTNKQIERSIQEIDQERRVSKATKEELGVVGNFMKDLQTPIHAVVSSLNNIQEEIEDANLKNSLIECWKTAKQSLKLFQESEKHIGDWAQSQQAALTVVNLREYFKEALVQVQAFIGDNQRLRLLFDPAIAERCNLAVDLVDQALRDCLPILSKFLVAGDVITVSVAQKKSLNFANAAPDQLIVRIETGQATTLSWESSWTQSVHLQHADQGAPVQWVTLRNRLVNNYGNMEPIVQSDKLQGLELQFFFQAAQ